MLSIHGYFNQAAISKACRSIFSVLSAEDVVDTVVDWFRIVDSPIMRPAPATSIKRFPQGLDIETTLSVGGETWRRRYKGP